ncbi:MAG: EscU/YscU/HrcU family type III secretion system export apparatus switch protein [Candidatus Margulisbacteria bacterium]|nr:EscU/YscU/HrcU family type III secretion system export apparatus switch protein [Candidatus Margulisiibacteriota bacterium]
MTASNKSRRSRRKELERKLKKRAEELETVRKREERTAVALSYDIDKDAAPVVLAAGRGALAEEILRIAEENKIPLFEDRKLANLLSRIEIETEVPAELYVLVAEILAFIFKLDQMAGKREYFEKRAKEMGI